MICNIPWEDFFAELSRVLPQLKSINARKSRIDNIYDLGTEAGIAIPFRQLDDYESLGDLDIARMIVPHNCINASRFFVESDVSYPDRGPFAAKEESLPSFIQHHSETYGRMLFDLDAVIVFPEERTILMYQHEGWHGLIDCSKET